MVVAKHTPWLATILVMAIAGGAFGVLRRLIPLLVRPEESTRERDGQTDTGKEQLISALIFGAGVIVTVFPSLVLSFAGNLADLF
jgi:hypothetical protein